jgi:hypothetical protein
MPMPDPTIEAAGLILDGSLNEMRRVIEGLPPDVLGWRPAGDDTNPLAVLTVHAMHSTRWWLSVALGAPPPERDRPSEFRASATDAAELLSFFDRMAADCRALVATEKTFEAAGTFRPEPSTGDDPGTAAWALLHAVEHLREHVAHASLTRQLWEARRAPGEGS